MSDLKCARLMLRLAGRDLLAMQSLSTEAPDEAFGFFVQQALEKALKAWLALLGELYPLTHNLKTLLDRLAARGVDVQPWRETERYTPYAVRIRCTGVDPDTEAIDRDAAAASVQTLLAEVERRLDEAADANEPD